MADIFQMAGVAIVGGVLLIFLREKTPSIGFCMSMGLVTVLFLQVMPRVSAILAALESLFFTEHPMYGLLLQGIGISYVTELTAQLLSGAGEEGAAKAVLMTGNTGLALLALEPAAQILRATQALLS